MVKKISQDSPKVLGLDVSTKTIGWALFDISTKNLLELTHISPTPKPKVEDKIEELILKSYIFRNKLESYVADIKNISFNCSADIIMSSLFMKQFIKKNTKWIHIDIAGQSYKVNTIIKYASPEASGVGVRLLFAYFN